MNDYIPKLMKEVVSCLTYEIELNPTDVNLVVLRDAIVDHGADYMAMSCMNITEFPQSILEEKSCQCDECTCDEDLTVIVDGINLISQVNAEDHTFFDSSISKMCDLIVDLTENQKVMMDRIVELEKRKPVVNEYHTHNHNTPTYPSPSPWYIKSDTGSNYY